MSNDTLVPLLVVTNPMMVNADLLIVLFPDHIFHDNWINGSGQLPILFSFNCAGILAHCSFLIERLTSLKITFYIVSQ